MAPLVEEAEAKEKFPKELFPKMGDLGLLCVSYPKEYGGSQLSKIDECIWVEEISRICVGFASALMVQAGIATSLIRDYGKEDQKQKYLVPAIKGRKIGAYGLTERDAGSDPTAMKSFAKRDKDSYILNGSKMFTTNGPIADFITLTVWTDKEKGVRDGLSILIVDTDTPGFTVKTLSKMCIRSSPTGEEFFDNCLISKGNLIGEQGKGWDYTTEALHNGRILHAFTSIGLAQAAYEKAREHALKRVQYGRPVERFQGVNFKLVNMATEIEIARTFGYKAAWLSERKKDYAAMAAMSKLFASEVASRITSDAMQIYAGYGLLSDSILERYLRDSRRGTVTEGTSEIQRNIIARDIRHGLI
jgi:alkylation response protein AidB-like acyl-CoA dehydrogenase